MYSSLVKTKSPKTHATYRTIAKRLKDHKIDLSGHIKDEKTLKVYESTLDGIQFVTRKSTDPLIPYYNKTSRFDIKTALQNATKVYGQKAFRQGKVENAAHWALDASMAATVGVGFREIWRPVISDRGLRLKLARSSPGLGVPKLDQPFSNHFGPRTKRLDISSLHCAIHGDLCSIHIDETGFIMGSIKGLSNDVIVTNEFLRHTFVELILRDKLKVPTWFDLVIPDSQYSRLGLSLNLVQSEKINLTVRGTCGISGKFNCSGTLNLFGKHDVGGGARL